MATYATLADAVDPALTIEERHLSKADVLVDAALRERGMDPADVTLPQALLTELAVNHACRLAAIEGAIGEQSPLLDKAKQYGRNVELLAQALGREALGLTVAAGVGFGTVRLGRG